MQGELSGFGRRENLDLQPVGVVIFQISVYFFDQLRVVSSVFVQPENCRCIHGAGSGDGQFYPVADRSVFHLAHSPDVVCFNRVLEHDVARLVEYLYGAVGCNFECLVVRAVLFGLLSHQADVWNRTHGGRIEGSVGLAELNGFFVDVGVASVGNYRFGVLRLTVFVPHLPRRANHGRHRSVNDHVAGHVQVGDALVRVHHR